MIKERENDSQSLRLHLQCHLSPSLRYQPSILHGLLSWLSGKESTFQCRRRRFDPWFRKISWRRKWQPTPVFLPGKYYSQKHLAGYSPWGHKRVRHDLATKQQHFLFITYLILLLLIIKSI